MTTLNRPILMALFIFAFNLVTFAGDGGSTGGGNNQFEKFKASAFRLLKANLDPSSELFEKTESTLDDPGLNHEILDRDDNRNIISKDKKVAEIRGGQI